MADVWNRQGALRCECGGAVTVIVELRGVTPAQVTARCRKCLRDTGWIPLAALTPPDRLESPKDST